MKKLMLFALVMSILSCQDKSLLDKKIKALESENKRLKEILKKGTEDKLVSSELILLPHELHFKNDKKNTITGVFYQQQEYPPFELYIANEDLKPGTKIEYRITKEEKIEFDYVPKSHGEESLTVIAVFKNGPDKIMLHGYLDLPVK